MRLKHEDDNDEDDDEKGKQIIGACFNQSIYSFSSLARTRTNIRAHKYSVKKLISAVLLFCMYQPELLTSACVCVSILVTE